jgi:hypothetical protein
MTDPAFKLGAGKYVDQSEFSINRAAEQAVPATANIFPDAFRMLTVRDASPAATYARADGSVAPCSESSWTQRPLRFLRAVRLALDSLAAVLQTPPRVCASGNVVIFPPSAL